MLFQMAVVIHPDAGQTLTEEAPYQIEWQITDQLGRATLGIGTLPPIRLEHCREL
ncbi:MAG: hypothetical protein JRE63_08865 [Deltaproteobacteria bacterium]|nr:hypothetical protein [Deltaproteobacteria bacterium]